MESYGIHRVPVPPTWVNAFAIVVVTTAVILQWPELRWVALASLVLGLAAAVGLVAMRRRAKGNPPAARLNFPAD